MSASTAGSANAGPSTAVFARRRAKVQEHLKEAGLAALIVVPGANLHYLTGVRMGLSERVTAMVLPAEGEPRFVVPGFEAERVRRQSQIAGLFSYADEEGPGGAAARAIEGLSIAGQRVAADYRSVRLLESELFKGASGDFVIADAAPLLASLRARKDEAELVALEKAAALVEKAIDVVRRMVAPGVREDEIGAAVDKVIREAGPEAVGGSMIVSGERTAIPHATTTNKEIASGDLVWADIVISYQGYYGDITRTFVAGLPDRELAEVYRVVHDAQQAARRAARPGITGAQLDAVARDYIAAKGYGQYFTHRTGHGLGLEGHEEPYIVAGNDVPLVPGNVFTIEPGVYLPGRGGVRIEDDIAITKDGARSLTNYPRLFLP